MRAHSRATYFVSRGLAVQRFDRPSDRDDHRRVRKSDLAIGLLATADFCGILCLGCRRAREERPPPPIKTPSPELSGTAVPRQEVIRPACLSTVAIAGDRTLGDGSAIVHHDAMAALILSILGALRSGLRTRADLTIENLALRQQLANLRRTSGRLRLRNSDRAFWEVPSRLWSRWAEGAGCRQASHHAPLAPRRLPPVLAMEVALRQPVRWWNLRGDCATYPPDGRCQGGQGRAQNSLRLTEARHRHRRANRVPLHAAQVTAPALPDLAHLPRQPCRLAGID